ncbi:DUF1570 domain-containing protein [Brevundimonas variabilis]|uniref:DUF1570 domain-containing protein n=1 Tax=Brevundimonas variabilis TaxID=74312 RepID=A0A7W9FCV6_9CAUL|nr:DUF1570 domain-containing protein [Brevundimonas variabilis]MBB5744580.1 hypothetical protein [Brevundimonas variabilis]
MSPATIGKSLLAAAAIALSLSSPASAEWLRAETQNFIIYGDTNERTLRNYAQKVQRFDSFLRTYYPIPTDFEVPKLEVYLADGRRDMLKAEPSIGASVGGFYSPNSGRIHAVVDTDSAAGTLVLFHEYAHHFMFQMRANAYPAWFVEGFAEYYATADVRPDRIEFGRHDKDRMSFFVQLSPNSWAPMADVLKWKVLGSGRYRAGDYYAQAWGLTHYLLSTPERKQMLAQYLTAVTQGEDSLVAMERVTGRSAAQLQTDMRLYLSGSIQSFIPQVEFPTSDVEISRLSPSQAELIWLDLRLDREPVKVEPVEPAEGETEAVRRRRETAVREDAEHRAELIRTALAATQEPTDDLLRLRVAARAHRLSGNSKAGFELIEPHLTRTQTDPDLLRLAADLLLDQTGPETDPAEATGNLREARSYLVRSLDTDPLNFLTYRSINLTRVGQPGYPNDNDLNVLELANGLAPQSFDIRMRLAQAYLARERPDLALATVRPVANSPHGGSWTRRAKALVATAQAALGQPVEPVSEAPADPGEAEAEPAAD